MLPRFCADAVTVTRAPLKSERGADVRDWESAQSHSVQGCSVQPSSTSRDFGDRAEQVEDRWQLYAPPGSDIAAGDRVTANGVTYEIDGAPFEWKSPTGRVSHLQCRLVEWRG